MTNLSRTCSCPFPLNYFVDADSTDPDAMVTTSILEGTLRNAEAQGFPVFPRHPVTRPHSATRCPFVVTER